MPFYNVEITGDCTSLVNAAQNSIAAIEAVDRTSATAQMSLRGGDSVTSQLRAISAAREDAEKPIGIPITALGAGNAREDVQSVTSDVKSLSKEIDGISKLNVTVGGGSAISQMAGDLGDASTAMQAFAAMSKDSMKSAESDASNVTQQVNVMTGANEKSARSFASTGTSAQTSFGRMDRAATSSGRSMDNFRDGVSGASQEMDDLGEGGEKSLQRVGAAANQTGSSFGFQTRSVNEATRANYGLAGSARETSGAYSELAKQGGFYRDALSDISDAQGLIDGGAVTAGGNEIPNITNLRGRGSSSLPRGASSVSVRGGGGSGGGGGGGGRGRFSGGDDDFGSGIDSATHVAGLATAGGMIGLLATAGTAAVGLGSVYETLKQMPVAFSEAQMAAGEFDHALYQSVAAEEFSSRGDKVQIQAAEQLKQTASAMHDIGTEVGKIGIDNMNTALSVANDFLGQITPALKNLEPAIAPAIKGVGALGDAFVQGFSSPGAVQGITALGNTLADPKVEKGIEGLVSGAITSGGVLGTVMAHVAGAIGETGGPVQDSMMDGVIAGSMMGKGLGGKLAAGGIGGILMGMGAFDQEQGIDPTEGFLSGGLGALGGSALGKRLGERGLLGKEAGGRLGGVTGALAGEAVPYLAQKLDKATGTNTLGDAAQGAFDAFALSGGNLPIAGAGAFAGAAPGIKRGVNSVFPDAIKRPEDLPSGGGGLGSVARGIQSARQFLYDQTFGRGETPPPASAGAPSSPGASINRGGSSTMPDISGMLFGGLSSSSDSGAGGGGAVFAGRAGALPAGGGAGSIPGLGEQPVSGGGAPGRSNAPSGAPTPAANEPPQLPVPDIDKDFFKGAPAGAYSDTRIDAQGNVITGSRDASGKTTFDNTYQGGKQTHYTNDPTTGVSTLSGTMPDGAGGQTGSSYLETRSGQIFGQGSDGSTSYQSPLGTPSGDTPTGGTGGHASDLGAPGITAGFGSGARQVPSDVMQQMSSAATGGGGDAGQQTVTGRGAVTPAATADVPFPGGGGQTSGGGGGGSDKYPPDVPAETFDGIPGVGVPEPLTLSIDPNDPTHGTFTGVPDAPVGATLGAHGWGFDPSYSYGEVDAGTAKALQQQNITSQYGPVGRSQAPAAQGHGQFGKQSQALGTPISPNIASQLGIATPAINANAQSTNSLAAAQNTATATSHSLATAQQSEAQSSHALTTAQQQSQQTAQSLAQGLGQVSQNANANAQAQQGNATAMQGTAQSANAVGTSANTSAASVGALGQSIGATDQGAQGLTASIAAIGDATNASVSGAQAGLSALGTTAAESGAQAGASYGGGVASGISSTDGASAAAGAGNASAGVGGAASSDGSDSQSPSRKMMQIGKWMGEGLAIGMQNSASLAATAGASLGQTAVSATSNAQTDYNTALAGGFGAGLVAASNGVTPIAQDYGLMIGYSWAENVVTGAQNVLKSADFTALTVPKFGSALAQSIEGALGLLPPAGSGAQYYTTTSGSAGMVQMAPIQVTNTVMLDGQIIDTKINTQIDGAMTDLANSIGAQRG